MRRGHVESTSNLNSFSDIGYMHIEAYMEETCKIMYMDACTYMTMHVHLNPAAKNEGKLLLFRSTAVLK